MASAGTYRFRREAAFGLAAALLLAGLLAMLLVTGGIPTAHADGPVLTVSSSTTNPGGTVMVTGTGWSPATSYNLYVYGQARCKPNPICQPPSTAKPINSSPVPINSDGTLREFDFTFISTAAATNYVFTVVAADANESASVLVQVVPAGTPPSGTPVSSSPTAATGTTPTTVTTASPTATSQAAITPNNQTTTPTSSSGGNTLAIIVVTVLLLIGIAVLTGLLIVLPPKRRAIRAAWYGADNGGSPYYGAGSGATGGRRYGGSGPAASGPRRTTGGYAPPADTDPPAWMGGVAQWDNPPPRGSGPGPRTPRRPQGGD